MDSSNIRIQRALNQLASSNSRPFRMTPDAELLFTQFTKEVTSVVVEGAIEFSKHRNSTTLKVDDVTLFLGISLRCVCDSIAV